MLLKKLNLLLAISLPIQVFIVNFLKVKTLWIEQTYSTKFYPQISKLLRLLLGWIPFSFGDAVAFLLIAYLIYNIYQLIKNRFKTYLSFLTKIGALLAILHFCFYCFWGLNYFREPLAKKLNIEQSAYTTQQLINTTEKILVRLNEQHIKITKSDTVKVSNPDNIKEIFKKSINGYEHIAKIYPDLSYTYLDVKKSMVSWMHLYTQTSGYFNPITGEAQVNHRIPITGLPATVCHEMAHQIGWSAENDANFVSFLACTANEDLYYKYAGYRMAFKYLIIEVRKRDKIAYDKLWKQLNKGIRKDFSASRKYWNQFENPIEPFIKKGYNSYLKANNQTSGIKSYSYVVDLLIAYHQ